MLQKTSKHYLITTTEKGIDPFGTSHNDFSLVRPPPAERILDPPLKLTAVTQETQTKLKLLENKITAKEEQSIRNIPDACPLYKLTFEASDSWVI